MAKMRPELIEVVFYTVDFPEEPATSQELQTAYDELRKIDKNNDGKLDDGEVKQYREQRRKERVDGIFSALDKNGDGKISKDEVRGLWADNFADLDKNKDGFLDRQEVEAALQMKQDQQK
jgi:Ca2+-binding EF-hand superfamily protein